MICIIYYKSASIICIVKQLSFGSLFTVWKRPSFDHADAFSKFDHHQWNYYILRVLQKFHSRHIFQNPNQVKGRTSIAHVVGGGGKDSKGVSASKMADWKSSTRRRSNGSPPLSLLCMTVSGIQNMETHKYGTWYMVSARGIRSIISILKLCHPTPHSEFKTHTSLGSCKHIEHVHVSAASKLCILFICGKWYILVIRDPMHWHGLTKIQAWISNDMPNKYLMKWCFPESFHFSGKLSVAHMNRYYWKSIQISFSS